MITIGFLLLLLIINKEGDVSGREVQRPWGSKHIVKVLGKDCGKTGLAGAVSYTSSCPSRRLDHKGSGNESKRQGRGCIIQMPKCSLSSLPASVVMPSALRSYLVLRKNTHLLTSLLTGLRSCPSGVPEPNLLRGLSPPALNLCVLREGNYHAPKGHVYDNLPTECSCLTLWMRKWKDKTL